MGAFAGVTFAADRTDAANSTSRAPDSRRAVATAAGVVRVHGTRGNSRGVGGDVVSARLLASADSGTPDVWATVVDAGDRTYAASYVAPATGAFSTRRFHRDRIQRRRSPSSVGARAQLPRRRRRTSRRMRSWASRAKITFVIRAVNARRRAGGRRRRGRRVRAGVSPAGDTFGSFPAVARRRYRRSAADGGGYLVTWRADRVRYDSDGVPEPYVFNVTLGGAHVRGSPFFARLKPAARRRRGYHRVRLVGRVDDCATAKPSPSPDDRNTSSCRPATRSATTRRTTRSIR